MNDFYFSSDAYNVINEFYTVECVVYVEGEDDVVFWDNYFKLFDFRVKLESVGGKENLPPYINNILENNSRIIIATDSDYSDFFKSKHNHPLVIYTAGYSIENTMYCPQSLNLLIMSYTKKSESYYDKVLLWINQYLENIYDLMIYDMASEYFKKSTKVLGDSCQRFLANSNSPNIDINKVNKYINEKLNMISQNEINYIKDLLTKSRSQLYMNVKGHFLSSAVINLVREQVLIEKDKKITINLENLYSNTVNNCFRDNCTCAYKEKYKNDISNAIDYIRNAKEHL